MCSSIDTINKAIRYKPLAFSKGFGSEMNPLQDMIVEVEEAQLGKEYLRHIRHGRR